METKTDILNELTTLSPLIAGMKKVNVFTVPKGYFDSISNTVLACLPEDRDIINYPGNTQPTDVPVGYFDLLANSILDKIKASETAPDEIRNLSPLLYAIQNKNVFETPEGYFETLNSIIIVKINSSGSKEEIKAISPLLYSIQGKDVFEVPDAYFTNLPDTILKKVQPPTAKVISMHRRSLMVKYAVAAMMTGVIALGLYKYIDKPDSVVTVEIPVATLDASIEKGKRMNETEFNEALENLTEADIAKYLVKNGDIADVAVLGNNLDESSLPSQEDYLLDESTLENYIKEIEKTTLNN